MEKLPLLNLPERQFKITEIENGLVIWDLIRKKNVALTPEEWVRQHLLHYLVKDLSYPRALIKVESGLSYFKKKKRSDIVIYNNDGSAFMLIECKAPGIRLNKKSLNQAAMYNKSLKAKYLGISNGMKHFVWQLDTSANAYQNLKTFPEYQR